MSSGPPNKRIKKFLTYTKQLKVNNFHSSKSLDTVVAASPKRPTTTEQSSSLEALKRDPTKVQPIVTTAIFTRFPNDIRSAVGVST
jgi:hypothetical protein